MEFRHHPDAGSGPHARLGELITELTVLVDQRADAVGAELACHDLDAALAACDDAVLAADGEDLLAQVIVLGSGGTSAARRLPLAS